MVMNPALVVPDDSKSIRDGAIPGWRRGPRRLIIYYNHLLRCIAEHYRMPSMMTTPWRDLPENIRHTLLYGSGEEQIDFSFRIGRKTYKSIGPFEGILANMQRRQAESESDSVRERLKEYMTFRTCPECHGKRLKPESLAVTVDGLSIDDFNRLSVEKALEFVRKLELDEEKAHIAKDILKEIESRLKFLSDVGLAYLTLSRESGTLSGGEAQRIRLATQLGCGLVGVLYILDEPSIGLHQRDNDRLLATLKKLRDIGNTVVVVEHDMDTIFAADYVLDMGPAAGVNGGRLVAAGTPKEIMASKDSLTGKYMSGELEVKVPEKRMPGNGDFLEIIGAEHNNLKNVDVRIQEKAVWSTGFCAPRCRSISKWRIPPCRVSTAKSADWNTWARQLSLTRVRLDALRVPTQRLTPNFSVRSAICSRHCPNPKCADSAPDDSAST